MFQTPAIAVVLSSAAVAALALGVCALHRAGRIGRTGAHRGIRAELERTRRQLAQAQAEIAKNRQVIASQQTHCDNAQANSLRLAVIVARMKGDTEAEQRLLHTSAKVFTRRLLNTLSAVPSHKIPTVPSHKRTP